MMADETHAQALTRLITENMLRILTEGRKQIAKDGSLVTVDASPSDIREARAWVKTLEGKGEPMEAGSPLSELRRAAALRLSGGSIDMGEGLADTGS